MRSRGFYGAALLAAVLLIVLAAGGPAARAAGSCPTGRGGTAAGERGNGEKGFEHAALMGEPLVARPRDEPIPVPGLEHVVQLASGGTRDYALLSSGEVLAWGENQNGELGIEQGSGEEELCYGETHAKTPVPCRTVPRPVKVEGHPLSGVE